MRQCVGFGLRAAAKRAVLAIAGLAALAAAGQNELAGKILEAAGVRGGLVAHIGCGSGELTAALHPNGSYLVHGLDPDPAKVAEARKLILSRGLWGSVTVETHDADRLPYVDGLVNLLVATRPLRRAEWAEVVRVLSPGGVAMVQGARLGDVAALPGVAAKEVRIGGQTWLKLRKEWPRDIDQWTHYLHDASGNAVAHDNRVGPPRHIQWLAEPKRTRDHDALASLSAMTTSNGRLFYILDEGPTSLIHRPPRWRLIARDAFSGVLLWKRDIPDWVTHLYYFRSGPTQLPRRLVSVGDRVFVTLGLTAPVSMLDAATGKTLLEYPGSEKAEEIVWHDGRLLVVLGDMSIYNDEAPKIYGYWQMSVETEPKVRKAIVAYDAASGKELWRKAEPSMAYLVPLSLCAKGQRVFYLDSDNLHCLELGSGRELWKAPFPTSGLFLRGYAPTVVATDDVVLCLNWRRLCAFATTDGRKLWERKGAMGFASPADLFVVGDLVWTNPMTAAIWRQTRFNKEGKAITGIPIPRQNFLGNGGSEIWALDVRTGQLKKTLPRARVLPGGHHARCYRSKATERFMVCSRRGLEFVDLRDGDHVNNWWVRGVCQYGVLPANGLVYVPPDPCQCFNLIKVNWFLALSARSSLESVEAKPVLEKGPAYAGGRAAARSTTPPEPPSRALWQPPLKGSKPDEWPTYRADITRSGSTTSSVPAKLAVLWRSRPGGKLTAPVIAGGRVFVGADDAPLLACLDAATGKPLWRFLAGGRIDSPPTIADGLCVFGCGDGSVYCLRADDGRLVWRFKVSGVDARVVSRGRLESVWPVHGSVLVLDGVVYFAAGRSSYLDGGIKLFGLDLASGRKLYETTVSSRPVLPGKQVERGVGALPDVLVSDGRTINMRHLQFDRTLKLFDQAKLRTLVATTGLLEDCWFHRQNWRLGVPGLINSRAHPGRLASKPGNPYVLGMGKLIVFDADRAFAVLNPYSWLKTTGGPHRTYHEGHFHQKYSRYKAEFFPVGTRLCAWKNQRPGTGRSARRRSPASRLWARASDLQVRAMVLAREAIFVAGWRDAVAVQEKTGRPLDPENPDPRPCVLRTIAAADGKTIAEIKLDCEPVFDGMAAAHGRLFLSLKDGSVLCLGSER